MNLTVVFQQCNNVSLDVVRNQLSTSSGQQVQVTSPACALVSTHLRFLSFTLPPGNAVAGFGEPCAVRPRVDRRVLSIWYPIRGRRRAEIIEWGVLALHIPGPDGTRLASFSVRKPQIKSATAFPSGWADENAFEHAN